jgi:hypothetical protein
MINIKNCASPIDVLEDLKIKNDATYWSYSCNVLAINMEFVKLEE